jgi:hypothetical protein
MQRSWARILMSFHLYQIEYLGVIGLHLGEIPPELLSFISGHAYLLDSPIHKNQKFLRLTDSPL